MNNVIDFEKAWLEAEMAAMEAEIADDNSELWSGYTEWSIQTDLLSPSEQSFFKRKVKEGKIDV